MSANAAPGPDPATATPNTACPVCGQGLRCGVLAGEARCWCYGLPPIDRARWPAEATGRCLCPECLRPLTEPAADA